MNKPGDSVVDKNGLEWMVLNCEAIHLSDEVAVTLWREGFEPITIKVPTEAMLPHVDTYRATATISEQLGAEPLDRHAEKILEMQKYLRDRLGGEEYQRRVNELWGRGRGGSSGSSR